MSESKVAKLRDLFLKFWNPNVDVNPNELTIDQQDLLRKFLYLWRLKIILIVLNIIGTLSYLIKEAGVVTFILALLVIPFFIPLYYYTWFRSLHKALTTNSSLSFIWFFVTFAIHIVLTAFWALGVLPGTVGWITAGKGTNYGAAYSIVLFLVSIAVTIYCAAAVYLIIQVHSFYRSSGASVAAARNEMASSTASAAAASPTSVNIQVAPKY